jgi:hypothetical protein
MENALSTTIQFVMDEAHMKLLKFARDEVKKNETPTGVI